MFRLSRFSFVVVVRFRSCHGRVDFVSRPRNKHLFERSTTYNETVSNVCRGFVLFVAVRALIFHAAERQISIALVRAPPPFTLPPILLPPPHPSSLPFPSSSFSSFPFSLQRKKNDKKKGKRRKGRK